MPRRSVLGLSTALATVVTVALTSVTTAPSASAADRDCGDFRSQRDAQIFFLAAGGPHSDPHRLDSDGDGIACESNPAPYYYGTTPPGGGGSGEQTPEPQVTVVRSSVGLTVAPARRIAGETFRLTVSVRPATRRMVVVQRRVDGRWRSMGSSTTGNDGRASRVLTAPRAGTTYRALVEPATQGSKRYTAATSPTGRLQVERQRVVLTVDDRTVGVGQRVDAAVRVTPVRVGRRVALQARDGGRWRTIRTARVDRRGRTGFAVTPRLGSVSYRAVALRHRGAVQHTSASVTVTASDVTAPPAPYDVVATPGAGSVMLAWSRSTPADFSHHEVWVRSGGGSWSLLATTTATTYESGGLTDGTVYGFSVTSVDRVGNRSARSAEVMATPSAPMAGLSVAPRRGGWTRPTPAR